MKSNELALVQAAKEHLAKQFGDANWCRGTGIAPRPGGGFALRLTVDPEAAAGVKLPARFEGFDVEIVRISSYRPRSQKRRASGGG